MQTNAAGQVGLKLKPPWHNSNCSPGDVAAGVNAAAANGGFNAVWFGRAAGSETPARATAFRRPVDAGECQDWVAIAVAQGLDQGTAKHSLPAELVRRLLQFVLCAAVTATTSDRVFPGAEMASRNNARRPLRGKRRGRG